MNLDRVAPDFSASDREGKSYSLRDLSGRWLVLYFYPKDNTPGCTTEAIEFTAKLSEFQALDARVVGMSPDSIAAHGKFIDKHNLGILLLSDPDHSIAEAYGVWQLKKFMGKEFMGIIRSTFLIAPDRQIAKSWSNVRVKNHVDTVLSELQSIVNTPGS